MPHPCDYCRGPIQHPLSGRPHPERPPATYCCFGCLTLGEEILERDQPAGRFSGLGLRLGIGLLLIGQSMIFGLAASVDSETPADIKQLLQGGILAGTLLALVLLGGPLLRSFLIETRRGRITIESLFLLSLCGAMAASLQSFITGNGPVYFETVTVLLVVYSIGQAMMARAKNTAMAVGGLWANALSRCRRLHDGKVELIEVARIERGELVEILPGEAIPIDGRIHAGEGYIIESSTRGEPFPKSVGPGRIVLAGSHSVDARFEIEATANGRDRQVDQLLCSIERSCGVETSSSRLSQFLLPTIIFAAIGTFAYWTAVADWRSGLFHSMSVLLVACPCAIGLSAPIVRWTTLKRLAERGLMLRETRTVEELAKINRTVFDKTGTLTAERMELFHLESLRADISRDELIGLCTKLEAASNHPIARAFHDCASDCDAIVQSCRVVAGRGLEGVVFWNKRVMAFRLGEPSWISNEKPIEAEPQIKWLLLELDGIIAARIGLREKVRPALQETLSDFRQMRIPVEILSGDAADRVRLFGVQDFLAEQTPLDKIARIESLKRIGSKPLVVGDGINDAGALAAAHVGIAMASGEDLANAAAHGTLYSADLRVLPWAIQLCQRAERLVKSNLRRSLIYNGIGICLAACGMLHPVVAVVLMTVSSLFVIGSSSRIGMATMHARCEAHFGDSPIRNRISRWNDWVWIKATIHAIALVLQVFVFALLTSSTNRVSTWMALAIPIFGLMAWLWRRWKAIPFWVDSLWGTLTLGNLGMLIGWYADLGFRPLSLEETCSASLLMRDGGFRPWMWVGMLLGANLAMLLLTRRPHGERPHCLTAMLTGGNLAMCSGMALGGGLHPSLYFSTIAGAALSSLIAMTPGMILGMILGTELTLVAILRIMNNRRKRHLLKDRTHEKFEIGNTGRFHPVA